MGSPAVGLLKGEAVYKYLSFRRVRPRACWGTTQCRPSPPLIPGLSPRVRGNHANLPVPGLGEGSIPARAGEPMTG